MHYDESIVSKSQQKIAQKCIDCVKDGFQLEKPLKYVIKGLNPDEEIAKLEYQKLQKNEKEIKRIEREIKFTRNYASNFVKVIFEFDNKLKKLLYMSDIMRTTGFPLPRHIWSGVLDFHIPNSIIFGRVCDRERHKGGKYYFAPLEHIQFELIDKLERIEEKASDLFPYKVIESNVFIELISHFKYSYGAKEDLKRMAKELIITEKSPEFVKKLNQVKGLITNMKKIPHFGTVEYGAFKYISDIDVSTICIPYKEVTYFHIDQFGTPPKKHCRIISYLLNALEKFSLKS